MRAATTPISSRAGLRPALRRGTGPHLDPPFARADATAVRLLLDTWQSEVHELRATELGELHIAFSTGTALACPSHPDYEAWTLDVPKVLTLVSVPGGELVVRQDEGSSDVR